MTLIWTTLPAGVRREKGGSAWTARVSLVLTPRLETPDGDSTLAEFPEFLDWPKTLSGLSPNGIEFDLQLRNDDEVIATTTVRPSTNPVDAADSQAWLNIFSAAMRVENFEVPVADQTFQALPGSAIASYNGGEIVREIRDFYTAALNQDLKLTDEEPPLGRFTLPTTQSGGLQAVNETAIERFARFHKRSTQPRMMLGDDDAGDSELRQPESPDFHQVVSALGSHPHLIRKLGLVMDFDIPLDDLPLDTADEEPAIRLVPRNADFESTLHVHHWTALDYRVGSSSWFRLFSVAEESAEESAGFLALGEDTTIAQENFEHAALTLMQQAQSGDEEQAEFPSLLQGGMRVTHSEIPSMIERAMHEQALLEGSLQDMKREPVGGLRAATDDAETLFAEQLTLGVRADVKYVESDAWRSLCRREIRYESGNWSWPAAQSPLQDEGIIEPTAYTDHNADDSGLRATDDLFEWDGWSLVVARPDDGENITTLLPTSALVNGAAALTATISVPAGTLEPQRFGRCYTFRTRTVYLAGIGMSVEEADEIEQDFQESNLATTPICCLRVESAKPPVVFRAQNRGYGEAGDIIVLRDADKHEHRTHEFKLHVLPPEVPLRIAEKHGVFDDLDPQDSWQLISTHRGKLGQVDNGGGPENPEDELLEAIPAKELYTPYLPDPMVKQAVLSLPDDAGKVDMPRFDDVPRHARGRELARSCRLIVRAGRNGVRARVSGRDVAVEVTKGRMHEFEIAAKLSSDELSMSAFAHPDWHDNDSLTAAGERLSAAAASGEAPILAPARTVRIIYATQRPLTGPGFGRPLILPRALNDTSALLADDALKFDRQSTGRIDVYARWEDPVDDGRTAGFGTLANEIHAGGVDIDIADGKPLDPIELTQASRSPLSHDFGDTKHHEVTYSAVATSRFADFYPSDVTDDPENITLISDPVTLHVLSTAPPDAPDIAYVVPTYRSDHAGSVVSTIAGEHAIEHRGEGLRVYLKRGWFSSGIGEQLALLVATPSSSNQRQDDVSEWGINPLRDSAPLPGPLELEHVWGGTKRIDHWPLDGGSVGLVIYDVHFSEEHQLPFVDIEFLSQRAFMPLVRLAFARYQENAIENCELSEIAHADFVPLTPGRAVTVHKLNRTTWKLDMRGYSYNESAVSSDQDESIVRTSIVQAHIEYMPSKLSEDAAAWRPLGEAVTLEPDAIEPWRYHWTGQVGIGDYEFLSRMWRRRLVIQEFEPFETGGDNDVPMADRSRLISAYAVRI